MIQGNFNHEIQILSLRKSDDFGGFDGVVVGADWMLTSNRVNYPDTKLETYGQTTFDIKEETVGIGSTFIPFEDLNDEIVLKWIIDDGICNNLKRQNQQMLTKEHLFPVNNPSNLPWSN
jgi:hypothetical protein